jgi:hypothetical protein
MPRLVPSKPKFMETDVVRAWQAFTCDLDDGTALTIPRATRLRGDHVAVLRCPWCFLLDSEPDDVEPSVYTVSSEPQPTPRFTKPTKVRAKVRVLMGASAFEPGGEFTAPPATAEWLLNENYAEEA